MVLETRISQLYSGTGNQSSSVIMVEENPSLAAISWWRKRVSQPYSGTGNQSSTVVMVEENPSLAAMSWWRKPVSQPYSGGGINIFAAKLCGTKQCKDVIS